MATTNLSPIRSTTTEKLRNLAEAGAAHVIALWHARKNRRSVARLLEWNDHMLRDIGLTRGDVGSALASRLTDDPSNRLSAFSRERRFAARASAVERRNREP